MNDRQDRDQHRPLFDEHLLIAEIAQSHDGSLGTAHAYIDAVAAAGADAVKFQTHIADEESTPDEPWRVKFSPQDETRFEYWRRMEFSETQWLGLRDHCRDAGIVFISSPFSGAAVSLLDRIDVDAYKVASGELSNIPMLEQIASTSRPVIISSGMSGWDEIERAFGIFHHRGTEVAVLQCTSEYPCPPEKIGLNNIAALRERFPEAAIGLSDHSGTMFPGLAAATLGGSVLEIHVTFSRAMFGPDVAASITIDELTTLAAGINFIRTALAHPVDKNLVAESMIPLRRTFMKSLVAARTLERGTVLKPADIAFKKPGLGLAPDRLDDVIGRKLAIDLDRNERIDMDHLE